MTPPPPSSSAVDTEPIDVPGRPRSRVDTLEIPVVPARDRAQPTLTAAVPLPTPAPQRRRGPGVLALGAVAFVAAGAGVLAGGLGLGALDLDRLGILGLPGTSAATPESRAVGEPLEPASVTSVDPSGGSGLQESESGGWRTQTYTTAGFGNLKEGVGLLVDLGEARELGEVSLLGATSGLSVELRAADSASQDVDGFEVVATAETSGSATALDATGADAARYWLVWVTELAPTDGGFAAQIENVQLRAEG